MKYKFFEVVEYSYTCLEDPLSSLKPNISNDEMRGFCLPMHLNTEIHRGVLLSLDSVVFVPVNYIIISVEQVP